jgi:hypothetical protein
MIDDLPFKAVRSNGTDCLERADYSRARCEIH